MPDVPGAGIRGVRVWDSPMIDMEKLKMLRAAPAGDGPVSMSRGALAEICDTIEQLWKENNRLLDGFLESKMVQQLRQLEIENAAMVICLRKIGDTDYRGNRSPESEVAYTFLKAIGK